MAHYKIFNTADNLIGVAVKGEMLSVYTNESVLGYGNVSEAVDKNPGWRFEKVEETAYNDVAASFKGKWEPKADTGNDAPVPASNAVGVASLGSAEVTDAAA